MAIDLSRLNTRLQEIKDKDLDEIIAKGTYIPTLGNSYTKADLQTWLDKRIKFLERAKDLGEVSLETEKDLVYTNLSSETKLLADKVLAGEEVREESEADWEALVSIKLYQFLTEG